MSSAVPTVEPIVMDVHLPAGVAGPEPLDFDVRCFVVSHAAGVVLIDTGLPGSHEAIAAALLRIGADWPDVRGGMLSRGPAAFTADARQAEATLQRVATLDCARMIFSHGAEIADPRRALQDLLDDAGSETS